MSIEMNSRGESGSSRRYASTAAGSFILPERRGSSRARRSSGVGGLISAAAGSGPSAHSAAAESARDEAVPRNQAILFLIGAFLSRTAGFRSADRRAPRVAPRIPAILWSKNTRQRQNLRGEGEKKESS